MDDSTIKNNLRKKRNDLGLTQTEMASRLEISLNAYRKLESGSTRIINEHVGKFAKEAGVSLSELVNGFDPVPQDSGYIDELKDSYDRQIREMQAEYRQELARVVEDNRNLRIRMADKEANMDMKDKLIGYLEKRLAEYESAKTDEG